MLDPQRDGRSWKRVMSELRKLLTQSELSRAHQRLAMGVLGRAIKHLRPSLFERLWMGLNQGVRNLRAADWVKSDGDFCRWFRGVINVTIAEEKIRQRPSEPNKPQDAQKQRRVADRRWQQMDVTERHWEVVRLEKERVARERAKLDENSTLENDWRRWAEDQRDERRYRKLLAERARRRLREVRDRETM